MGKRLKVTGNINELAKYLNMDEYKILSIFDFEQRKSLKEIEKELKRREKENETTTNKGKAVQSSSKSI